MKCLKFIYPVFSTLQGYPGTNSQKQVIKQGRGESEVVLVQLLEKVKEFPALCPSEGLDGPRQGSVSECFGLSTTKNSGGHTHTDKMSKLFICLFIHVS